MPACLFKDILVIGAVIIAKSAEKRTFAYAEFFLGIIPYTYIVCVTLGESVARRNRLVLKSKV